MLSGVLACGQVRELVPGQVVEGALEPGTTHWYSVGLDSGQSCHTVVEQRGTDITITVLEPGGGKLLQIDSFERGRESVTFQATLAGPYRMGISGTRKGEYSLEVVRIRALTPVDSTMADAERHSSEAKRLQEQGTAASLRASLEENREALRLWRLVHDKRSELATLIKSGGAYHALGKYGKAREAFEIALLLSRELEDRPSEGEILNNLGTGYWREGNVDSGLNFLLQASEIWKEFGFQYEGAATASNLGILLWQTGEWQQALVHYLHALDVVRLLHDQRGEAFLLNNIGVAYNSLGEAQKALDYLSQALAIFRTVGDGAAAGRTLGVIGRIHLAAGLTDKALISEQEALQLARAAGDARSESEALNSIGMARDAASDRAGAREYYEQALTKSHALNDHRGEAVALQNIALVEPDPGKALELLTRSLELHKSTGARDSQAQALYWMARLERDGGNLPEARSQIETALDITESLRLKVAGPSLRTSYFASKQDYYHFYIDLLMQQGEESSAFGAAERTRGRSLSDLLSEIGGEIRQGVDSAILNRERVLQRQLNFKAQKAAPREEMDRLFAGLEAVEAEIRGASPRYAALMQPKPLKVDEVQRTVLDPNTLLLEYSLGADCSYLWAVSSKGLRSYRLPAKSVIERAARRVTDLVGVRPQGRAEAWEAAAAALSGMVLGPASAQLTAKRLLIVSDGALQYIPWAALPKPGNSAIPLLRDHEIVSAPSASIVAVLRRQLLDRKRAPKSLAILADPVFGASDSRVEVPAADTTPPRYARLPFTRIEASGIRSVAPPDAESLLDFSASKAALTSVRMRRYRVLHIATHAVIDDAHPELSAVVLSTVDPHGKAVDGILRLHEVYNMVLPAELVVLSACETGLGPEVRGEGLVGLTRGFMYAGTPRVLVSLWKVDDAATAELMKRFYEGLYGNQALRPAAALRTAQLYMSSQRRWAAPFFWAGFVFQGEWR